jgi:hypothetical protein
MPSAMILSNQSVDEVRFEQTALRGMIFLAKLTGARGGAGAELT